MKPYIHALSSAKKWGGQPENYLDIHNWFDQTKAHFATVAHRCLLHSSWGVFLCEQVFGTNITNSDGRLVSVRDIGEQHVIEDLKCIPTVSDYLMNMQYQPWMGGQGLPPSMNCTKTQKKETQFIPFDEPLENIPSPLDVVYDGAQVFIDGGSKSYYDKAQPRDPRYLD